jgi:type II secretory pathway component GspD/PulD (secretin)
MRYVLVWSVLLCMGAMAGPLTAPAEAGGGDEATAFLIEADTPVEVAELLRQVSLAADVRIQFDPESKTLRNATLGGARVRLSGSRADLIDQLRRLLVAYDLVVSPVGPPTAHHYLVEDVKGSNAMFRLHPEFVSIHAGNVDALGAQAGRFVTTWIPLQHVGDLRNARAALQRLVSQGNVGSVTEVPQAGGLVVTDFAPNVASVFRIIVAMDRASAGTTTAGTTVAIPVEHGNAVDLAALLVAHYADVPAGPTTRGAAPEASGAQPPRITADRRTNRVLVTGSDEAVEAVRAALALLDVPVPGAPAKALAASPSLHVALVHLEHARADDAANRLMNLMQQTRGAWDRDFRPGVVPDERTNSLLVSGDADALARLREIVALLDVPAPAAR